MDNIVDKIDSLEQAVKVLNEHKHRRWPSTSEWRILQVGVERRCTNKRMPDAEDLLTEFEAIAIAEKYCREK